MYHYKGMNTCINHKYWMGKSVLNMTFKMYQCFIEEGSVAILYQLLTYMLCTSI